MKRHIRVYRSLLDADIVFPVNILRYISKKYPSSSKNLTSLYNAEIDPSCCNDCHQLLLAVVISFNPLIKNTDNSIWLWPLDHCPPVIWLWPLSKRFLLYTHLLFTEKDRPPGILKVAKFDRRQSHYVLIRTWTAK
jgi:hypothetical protein